MELRLTESNLTTGNYLTAWDVTAGATVFEIGEDGIITAGTSANTWNDATGFILHDALVDCADTQILKWSTGGGRWGCASDATGSATAWDDITDPDAGASIAFAQFAQTMDWNMASDAALTGMAFTLTNDIAGSNTQYLMYLDNVDDAGADGVTEALLVLDNSDANEAVTDGILFAGNTFTDYIDTPSSVFKVDGSGNVTGVNGTFTGTSFTASSATTVTLGSSGVDSITIGNGGADSILIGNAAAASTITIGNASATTVSITDNNWNIAADGSANFISIGATSPGTGAFTTLSANNDIDFTLLY